MKENYKKIIFTACAAFFLLSAGFAFAALEVNYPLVHNFAPSSTSTISEYLKYVFDVGIFIGFFAMFLTLIWAGILYFLSPVIPNALADAKDRVYGAISGLLILVLLYLVITTINPALSFFQTRDLNKISEIKQPIVSGVILFSEKNCPFWQNKTRYGGSISNLQDLGLNKRVQSVKIINDPGMNMYNTDSVYYNAILYEKQNYQGKCFFINYMTDCQTNIKPFATSASIYKYGYAEGNIIFYRNAGFNPNGGYITLESSEIQQATDRQGMYIKNLEGLKFTESSSSNNCTVPDDEQDCILWDNNGVCQKRVCPSLSEKNIGSIQINGNYLVLLVYYAPTDPPQGPWSLCQAFPISKNITQQSFLGSGTIQSPADVNNEGPRQIKWEDIQGNNDLGKLPNYVVIIPIKK